MPRSIESMNEAGYSSDPFDSAAEAGARSSVNMSLRIFTKGLVAALGTGALIDHLATHAGAQDKKVDVVALSEDELKNIREKRKKVEEIRSKIREKGLAKDSAPFRVVKQLYADVEKPVTSLLPDMDQKPVHALSKQKKRALKEYLQSIGAINTVTRKDGEEEFQLVHRYANALRAWIRAYMNANGKVGKVMKQPDKKAEVEKPKYRRLPSGRPVTGEEVPGVEKIDGAMDAFMKKIGATTGTLSVLAQNGYKINRGYGYVGAVEGDEHVTQPDTLMRVASCSKPFVAAAVMHLVENRELRLDSKVLDILKLRQEPRDARMKSITIEHLLNHQGGFDRNASNDPVFQRDAIARKLGRSRDHLHPVDVARYMLDRRLDFTPGAMDKTNGGSKPVEKYSNFGYLLLGLVVEKVSGQSCEKYVQENVCAPLGIRDVHLSPTKPEKRREKVEYPGNPSMELHQYGGGFATSASSLATLMAHRKVRGERRQKGDRVSEYQRGSLKGTTAYMGFWRGYAFAFIANNRTGDRKERQETTEELADAIKRFLASQ